MCATEGEVDLLAEVAPADAARVRRSEHARLVSVDAMRALFGSVEGGAEGLPLEDRRAVAGADGEHRAGPGHWSRR